MSGSAAGAEPPGLQRERTVLAWDRTALALALVGLLLARSAGPPYLRLAHLAGLSVAAFGAALLFRSRRRAAELAVADTEVAPATATFRLLTVAVVLGGISALTSIALGLDRG